MPANTTHHRSDSEMHSQGQYDNARMERARGINVYKDPIDYDNFHHQVSIELKPYKQVITCRKQDRSKIPYELILDILPPVTLRYQFVAGFIMKFSIHAVWLPRQIANHLRWKIWECIRQNPYEPGLKDIIEMIHEDLPGLYEYYNEIWPILPNNPDHQYEEDYYYSISNGRKMKNIYEYVISYNENFARRKEGKCFCFEETCNCSIRLMRPRTEQFLDIQEAEFERIEEEVGRNIFDVENFQRCEEDWGCYGHVIIEQERTTKKDIILDNEAFSVYQLPPILIQYDIRRCYPVSPAKIIVTGYWLPDSLRKELQSRVDEKCEQITGVVLEECVKVIKEHMKEIEEIDIRGAKWADTLDFFHYNYFNQVFDRINYIRSYDSKSWKLYSKNPLKQLDSIVKDEIMWIGNMDE